MELKQIMLFSTILQYHQFSLGPCCRLIYPCLLFGSRIRAIILGIIMRRVVIIMDFGIRSKTDLMGLQHAQMYAQWAMH